MVIFRAFLFKKLGKNSFSVLIWQKLWLISQYYIFALFEIFLKQKKLPLALKMAKIILLKKLSIYDYINSNMFYLISFYSILTKAIQVVIVEKISYLIKKYSFLLLNHYRVLKQKYTTNILFIIQEKIY